MDPVTIFTIIWLLLSIIPLVLWLRARHTRNRFERRITEAEATAESLKERYAPITSVEDEISTLTGEAAEI